MKFSEEEAESLHRSPFESLKFYLLFPFTTFIVGPRILDTVHSLLSIRLSSSRGWNLDVNKNQTQLMKTGEQGKVYKCQAFVYIL